MQRDGMLQRSMAGRSTSIHGSIRNDVSNNFNGILLVGVKNNSILDNTVRRNLGYGIRLEKADGNTVRNNSLDENLLGAISFILFRKCRRNAA